MRTRVTKAAVTTTVLAVLALAGCASPEDEPDAPDDEAQQQTADPTEGLESEESSVEPGLASCEFNNSVADQDADGPADYSGGTLQNAELRETEDAYEITLTGDFFDPEELFAEQTEVGFTVELLADDVDEVAELETTYESGDVIFSGVRTSNSDIEQDTTPELQDGTFSAIYPKDVDELADFEPNMWLVRVEFNEGITDEANPDESVRPVTFRCGDGSPLSWEPRADG